MTRKLANTPTPLVSNKGPVLLNPGPVNTSARVRSALLRDDECHRDPSYSESLTRLRSKLHLVFGGSETHQVAVITGSGTAAMEASLASVLKPGERILVLDNGTFGHRVAEIAQVHELDVIHLHFDHGEAISVDSVQQVLEEDSSIKAMAVVHHETSVGLVNPVGALGKLAKRHEILFLVDAVSSLGAEDVDVSRDSIDLCWASANKCMHGIPGVSFVCASKKARTRIEANRPRSYYLDLKRYFHYHEELAQTPFTPAVSAYYALEAACDEFLEMGKVGRLEMYRRRNRHLREGLKRLGLRMLTEIGSESSSVVTVSLPKGMDFVSMFHRLRERNFVVYECKAPLKGEFFQVANMGELSEFDLDAFLVALAQIIDAKVEPLALVAP